MDSLNDSVNISELGNFELKYTEELDDIIDIVFADDDNDLVDAFPSDAATSTVDAKYKELLQQSEFESLLKPEVPSNLTTQPVKRFREFSADKLKSWRHESNERKY